MNNKVVTAAPNSKESEMMVLGCMLTSSSALSIGADGLNDSDFYYAEHIIIFKALQAAFAGEKPADVHLIAEELKRIDKLEAVGGVSYLTTLVQYAGTSAYIEEYIGIVRKKSILRQMIEASIGIQKLAFDEPSDVYSALDEAQGKFFVISQSANHTLGLTVKDLLTGIKSTSRLPYLKELQEKQEAFSTRDPKKPLVTGLASGFIDLDRLTSGFNPSNLAILAARPSMGKTALALNIASHIAFKQGTPVAVFSLEMTAEELLHRLICSISEVESEKIKMGSIDGFEYQKIVAAVNEMSKYSLIIDDQPGMKITDLRARARRLKEVHGIGFMVVDYLQLLSGAKGYYSSENRQNEISEISRMLKNLARELNIPILCLSQLSRKVEERAGHRPMLSDLRESGCLAGDTLIQDAESGTYYTMKELAERKVQTPLTVYALGDDLKIGKHTMSKVFYSGQKTLYELKLRSGRTIKASSNHPFRKLNGWTALETLAAGDRIAIPRQLSSKKRPQKLKNEEITFLAHLLGDGCILPKQPYHYTSADEINITTVNECASSLFSIQPRIVKQENWYHTYFPSPFPLTRKRYHPITTWFSDLGIERVRSYDKRIPSALFECDDLQISLFLHHLWATDGNVSLAKQEKRSPGAAIYYASSSPLLSQQVQQLLLRVGIASTVRQTPSKKGYRPMYHVSIQGASYQKRFLSTVGCAGKRGEIIPTLLSHLEKIEENPNVDTIPREAWQMYVTPAKDAAHLSWRDVCKKLNTSYGGSSLFKNGISRTRMRSLSEVCSSRELLELAESDIYWDEILSIDALGVEDVYDATVEDVHNFVANDIIVHNSIEQDADLVMFVFRREYYNASDKPGMAELLVAKNRHGQVGEVKLAFRKHLAQFQNYTEEENLDSSKSDESFHSYTLN